MEKMNKENLQKMADYIRTVHQEIFDMDSFRSFDFTSHKCNSVGCVIGHCTILDSKENIDNFLSMSIFTDEVMIDFYSWSKSFTGINDEDIWQWCFSPYWDKTDNTPEGAALRIERLINHGLPEDWREQIRGDIELCYYN